MNALEQQEILEEKVLDKGFVRLIDFMGGDAGVVLGARVSYAQGLKGEEKDKKLISYLLRHSHMTPFEQAVFKFHAKTPIFVMRQWIRHRWGCMAGDTRLYFDLPSRKTKGKKGLYSMSVKDFYEKWHYGAQSITNYLKRINLDAVADEKIYSVPELVKVAAFSASQIRTQIRNRRIKAEAIQTYYGHKWHIRGKDFKDYVLKRRQKEIRMPMRDKLRAMWLRSLSEETKEIEYTHIKEIWDTGIKDIFKVTLENGYSISITQDHKVLTTHGWQTLKETVGLGLVGEKACWSKEATLFVNGIALHQSKEWLAEKRSLGWSISQMAEAAGISYHSIRKWLKIHKLQFKPEERDFHKGHTPWNEGLHYKLNRTLTEKQRAAVREARSGSKSNFWKGGVSTDRENIGRWTREHAERVHAKHSFACQLCLEKSSRLVAHHVIPVWLAPELGRNFDNLTTLCAPCHRAIHSQNKEIEFAKAYATPTLKDFLKTLKIKQKPRPPKTFLRVVPAKVVSVEYAGKAPTYDIEVEGPHHNFIANGIVVHNSFNEHSARYAEMLDEFYIPAEFRKQDVKNKQGSLVATTEIDQEKALAEYVKTIDQTYQTYKSLLNRGAAREMARMVLPTALYTQFYWTANARSLMNFILLRAEGHAQWEIQQYAAVLANFFKIKMPWTYEAFLRYVWKSGNPILDAEKAALEKGQQGQ